MTKKSFTAYSVFPSVQAGAGAAGKLARSGIESPVFVRHELEAFCRTGEIEYRDGIAHTWLVGLRTRPVDCLLDPSLVLSEKQALDQGIALLKGQIATVNEELEALNPDSFDHQLAMQARAAAENNVVARYASVKASVVHLKASMPRFERRASVEATQAINAVLERDKLLNGRTLEVLRKQASHAAHAHLRADQRSRGIEKRIGRLEAEDTTNRTAMSEAQQEALKAPGLKKLQAFADDTECGPTFMEQAGERERQLTEQLDASRERARFQFGEAQKFVAAGGEKRIAEIASELAEVIARIGWIETRGQAELTGQCTDAQLEIDSMREPARKLDEGIRKLSSKLAKMAETLPDPDPASPDDLASVTLYTWSESLRTESDPQELMVTLDQIIEDMESEDSTAHRSGLERAREEYETTHRRLCEEINRVCGDKSLSIAEHVRVRLEHAKANADIIAGMYDTTAANYEKNKQANNTAKDHLDKEWEQISAWLRNFTLRLPDNLQVMKKVFAPKVDPISREVVRAGFVVEATLAKDEEVRLALDDIIRSVEDYEKAREGAAGHDVAFRENLVSSLRADIRSTFYRRVILAPRISVHMPSISYKPLAMEKGMASSGQGIAMTLLWILKMADYVNERELRRNSVDAAKRKRLREDRSQFAFIDGAFSHLSDKQLIDNALAGIEESHGRFQLIVTGHDPAYENDFDRFGTFIAAREIGGRYMYAECETRSPLDAHSVGSYEGAMEAMHTIKIPNPTSQAM